MDASKLTPSGRYTLLINLVGPGNFLEVAKILPLLAGGGKDSPAFHIVAPSLPNFGFSEGTKRRGFGLPQYAETCHKLMHKLGYKEYVTQGQPELQVEWNTKMLTGSRWRLGQHDYADDGPLISRVLQGVAHQYDRSQCSEMDIAAFSSPPTCTHPALQTRPGRPRKDSMVFPRRQWLQIYTIYKTSDIGLRTGRQSRRPTGLDI